MTTLSKALYRTALKMINNNGRKVKLYLVDVGNGDDYDPTTSINTPATPTEVEVKAIFLDFSILTSGKIAMANSLIEVGDKEIYLLPTDTSGNPLPRELNAVGDYLIDHNGDRWAIKLVKLYDPSGSSPIMYDLVGRR